MSITPLQSACGKESVLEWKGFGALMGGIRCVSGKESVPEWEGIGVLLGEIRCLGTSADHLPDIGGFLAVSAPS